VERQVFEVLGHHLSCLVGGDRANPALFILHGWSAEGSLFQPLGRRLEGSYFVVIQDLPGFGESEILSVARLEEFAEVLEGLVETLGLTKAIFVGHSMGGAIAAEFARRYPDRVEKLVLVDCPVLTQRSMVGWVWVALKKTWRSLRLGKIQKASWVGSSFFRSLRKHPLWFLQTLRMTITCDLRATLGQLLTETAVLWAQHDEYFPSWEPICEALGVKARIIEGAGHDWPILDPARAESEIRLLLR
jgi:pimeloyl-ACP methyl ester carboxylesterase